MARVTLPMGITRISGRVGNACFRTMKATGRTYMGSLPSKRTSQVSAREMAVRERFTQKAQLVRAMRQAGSKLSQKELWKLADQAL